MIRHSLKQASLVIASVLLLSPLGGYAQSAPSGDRWLHVRVVSTDSNGESVSVNVPLELAEKVLPAINKNQLHGGKAVSYTHLDVYKRQQQDGSDHQ